MANNWMIRARRSGIYIEDFEKGYATLLNSGIGEVQTTKLQLSDTVVDEALN